MCQRIHEWDGPLKLEEVPIPKADGNACRVKVEACGIGLTVLNAIRGDLGSDPDMLPRIPGHEIVGTVVEVGPEVATLAVGDRVMVYFYLTCGACERCRAGLEPLCERFSGFVGVHVDGGYAEYVSLPERVCVRVPKDLDAVQATVIPDAVGTPVHVCGSRANIRPHHRVAILGAGGGVGAHMIQVAEVFGAEVVGIDVDMTKLDRLRELSGCEIATFDEVSFTQDEFDVVIDLVGRRPTLEWALRALKRRGRMVLLTTFPEERFEVDPAKAVFGELEIVGSRYVPYAELDLAAQLVDSGRVTPVVSEVRPLERVEDIHDLLRTGSLFGRGAVVFDGQEASG